MKIVAPEAQGFSIFCDDVREEINAKTTFVGTYVGEMLVAAVGPAIIPQLCYIGKVFLDPENLPGELKIVLRRFNSSGEMIEMARVDFPPVSEIPVPEQPVIYGPEIRRIQLQAALRISPLPVNEDFTIQAILLVDSVEQSIGSITVRRVDSLP